MLIEVCHDHVYYVSGAFLGHSQRSLISNRGEWRVQCQKNGLALWVSMNSGVDKHKDVFEELGKQQDS
jgi:hypothetical protein